MLTTGKLLPAFKARLLEAERIDLAVAWVGNGPQTDALVEVTEKRRIKVRAVVGLAGNITDPIALRDLAGCSELRIPDRGLHPGGIFHPKIFIFHSAAGNVAWIGSANLTNGGFLQNYEAVLELDDPSDLIKWFSGLWSRLDANAGPVIAHYIANWKPPPVLQPSSRTTTTIASRRLPTLDDDPPANWAEFLQALQLADQFWLRKSGGAWSVLAEGSSWTDTIRAGQSVVRKRNWDGLTKHERHVLLGRPEANSAYGLLGSLGNAQAANHLFRGTTLTDRQTLRRLRKAFGPVFSADTSAGAIDAACTALTVMTNVDRIGAGVATRLLALARPDVCISVNDGSRSRLAELTNLPRTTLGKPTNYRKLLTWVVNQPWYKAEPSDPWEASIWSMRAALIDCFVYEP